MQGCLSLLFLCTENIEPRKMLVALIVVVCVFSGRPGPELAWTFSDGYQTKPDSISVNNISLLSIPPHVCIPPLFTHFVVFPEDV